MFQLNLKNVDTAKRSLDGMSCVNFNTYNDLPHAARGIPFSEGTVGSILPFVSQLSLVAWIRIRCRAGLSASIVGQKLSTLMFSNASCSFINAYNLLKTDSYD